MRKDVPATSDSACSAEPSTGQMFDRIAPTYDLLNHLLSFGRDCAWRRRVARQLDSARNLKVADLATGTGDMLISLLGQRPDITEAIGLDISENMLEVCRAKVRRRSLEDRIRLLRADASSAPFPDSLFDAATMAFGIRNTSDARATLREIHRLLRPGGIALILEFSLPKNRVFRWCHLQYLRHGIPLIGAVVSGDRHAYRYLNESIEAFYPPSEFCALMTEAGFGQVSATPLTWGVASIYRGLKGSG